MLNTFFGQIKERLGRCKWTRQQVKRIRKTEMVIEIDWKNTTADMSLWQQLQLAETKHVTLADQVNTICLHSHLSVFCWTLYTIRLVVKVVGGGGGGSGSGFFVQRNKLPGRQILIQNNTYQTKNMFKEQLIWL